MPTEVAVYQLPGHPRSQTVCHAMAAGIRRVGDRPVMLASFSYRKPDHPCAVFYGLAGNMARALKEYPEAGRPAVYIDLGYWGRKQGGRWAGYHKLSVNGRHPTAYFQRRRHDGTRAACFGLRASPWRCSTPTSPILLCGMGPKGARAEGYAPNEWERLAVATLREVTARPIIYRPKPNWAQFRPIPGCETDWGTDLADVLSQRRVHAVVSHHSNANVEALVAGFPGIVLGGIATVQSSDDLATIESPLMLPTRQQWIDDAAWTQFNIDEMAAGAAWRHLKDEGLVP